MSVNGDELKLLRLSNRLTVYGCVYVLLSNLVTVVFRADFLNEINRNLFTVPEDQRNLISPHRFPLENPDFSAMHRYKQVSNQLFYKFT